MMLEPSIDLLLEKIDSKYSMVILASKRAHELDGSSKPLLEDYSSVKSVGKALEEIEKGVVLMHPNPDLKREMQRMKQVEEEMIRDREKKEMEVRIQKEQRDNRI